MAEKTNKLGGEGVASRTQRSRAGYLVADDVLGLIAGTPLVRLARFSPEGGAMVWAKCEFANPGGSVKDRPALAMLLDAERSGKLREGATIVEATSGNTGISLAMIAAVRGYRCILVMPEDMSLERRYILRAYGAEIVLTPAPEGMAGAVRKAAQILADTDGAFMPSQFDNPANPISHAEGTALEIIEQVNGELSGFVAGIGTGGTISGVGRVLREKFPKIPIWGVEPANSAVLNGKQPGMHGIQGLGAGFVPDVLEKSVLDAVREVTDVAAERMARRLAREAGLLVGPSSGANVHAACELAATLPAGNIVTILCDSGERYLF